MNHTASSASQAHIQAIIAKIHLLDPAYDTTTLQLSQFFCKEYHHPFAHGWIIWSQPCGAYFISDRFYVHWLRLGGSQGLLGYPLTDQLATRTSDGYFCDFQGGSIYASGESGVAAKRRL